MAEIANVCLKLSNRAENVLVVRQALSGVAETLGLDAIEANDIITAVTEACNNVVLHAYPIEGEGVMEVEVWALARSVAVTVRDHGRGIDAKELDPARAPAGIGLPVMRALAQRVEWSAVPGGGSQVRMEFAAPKARVLKWADQEPAPQLDTRAQIAGAVEMTLAPDSIARSVLPRVLSALAARAYFSTDRISDVQLVADALVASAHDSIIGSHLGIGVELAPRDLELRAGPLRRGRAERMLSATADGSARVLKRLTDSQLVAPGDASEILALRIRERR